MAQWEKIRDAGLYNTISSIYAPQQFPVEVRALIASWLEENVFSSQLDPSNPEHAPYLFGFRKAMIEQIKYKLNQEMTGNPEIVFWYKKTLSEYAKSLEEKDPGPLFAMVKYCLDQEQLILTNAVPNSAQPSLDFQQSVNLQHSANKYLLLKRRLDTLTNNQLENLRKTLNNMSVIVDQIGVHKEDLNAGQNLIDNPMSRTNGCAPVERLIVLRNGLQSAIQNKKENFKLHMNYILPLTTSVSVEVEGIQQDIIAEIGHWKYEQRQVANGFTGTKCLEKIEELACLLATALIEVHRQVGEMDRLQRAEMTHTGGHYPDDVFQQHSFLKEKLKSLLQSLVCETFVVENQHSQILRTQVSKIKPIKVRLLVARVLNPNLTCKVTVSFINEEQARKHFENPSHIPLSSARLTNFEKPMSMDSKSRTFVVEFNGLAFGSKPPRENKKGSQAVAKSVAEQKYCFFFTSTFPVLDYKFQVYTTSMPVVKTCHPVQDPTALGTIIWDNVFALPNRIPFEVPTEIPVDELMTALDTKFKAVTGKGLTKDNKEFLIKKLFRTSSSLPSHMMVTWDQFFKDPLPGVLITNRDKEKKPTVSFWEWLFAIMKMCERTDDPKKKKENLLFQKLWETGKIEGFISAEDIEMKLKEKPEGTFMLRFSDTVLGAVTLNFYAFSSNGNHGKLQRYQPYTLEDLNQIPLGQRILRRKDLKYLYPDIPKENTFSKAVLEDNTEVELLREKYIIWSIEEVQLEAEKQRHLSTSSSSTGSPWSTSSHPSSSVNPFSPSSASGFGSPSSSYLPATASGSQRSHQGGMSDGTTSERFNLNHSSLPKFEEVYWELEESGLIYELESGEQMRDDFIQDKNNGE